MNLERFRLATKRSDTPAPDDQAWTEWRREQVTNLVRRVSIEARVINPRIKISAALIPWGQPPTGEEDFERVAPMQRIFQDWHRWLQEGWLDLGIPMNYASETDDRVRGWFDGWIRFEKQHQHGRQLAVGLGAYRNTPANTLAQVSRVRGDDDGRVVGMSFYSYNGLEARGRSRSRAPTRRAVATTGADRLAFLADGVAGSAAPFARPAAVPAMPWIERPERGWIAGTVAATTAGGNDGIEVKITRRRAWPFGNTTRVRTDGNGYFGLGKLKPGRYEVSVGTRRRCTPVRSPRRRGPGWTGKLLVHGVSTQLRVMADKPAPQSPRRPQRNSPINSLRPRRPRR